MAYGNGMKKLSPLEDAQILSVLEKYCPAPGKILDAGCGRGERLAAIHGAYPGCALFGADIDGENAAAARAACPGADVRTGSFVPSPSDLRGMDAVLCECTLSLTDNPAAALGALNEALRPGGVLILGDICVPGDGEPLALGCGTVRRLFSRKWLERALSDAGFTLLEYADCRAALLTMAAEMIFDGSFCTCVDVGAGAALKNHRAGYGLWVGKKEREV